MVRRVILLVGEETSVFRSENIWSFYHQLILSQGHVRCIFPAGRLRKCAVVPSLGHSLFNCWCRKCQGARLHSHTALWVKSGNRGNLKCLKVDNNFAVIFHRKTFILFLSDAKLLKVYDRFLGLIVYVKYLRSFLQKKT